MTNYLKRTNSDGVVVYQPEGVNMHIPHDPMNMDYDRMMEEVEAGTSTIEETE